MPGVREGDIFDAVVVGGGPAGSAAAYTLARNNIRTCLIDKKTFPRDKLCGGLVTLRSKTIFESVFDQHWDEEIFLSSSRVAFFSDGRPLGDRINYSQLFFTNRFQFDDYLQSFLKETNTIRKLGCTIVNIELDANRLTLDTGETVQFRYLIGADGVNSQIAKALFGASFDPDTIGFGLEVEVPRSSLPLQDDTVEIDFAAARWGYGWTFPKTKSFTMGVGGIHKLNSNLRSSLARYLHHRGLDISDFRIKGQYIPFGDFRRSPGRGSILLCGDAAGVVDPITGEGIGYAMQSGAAAANAISRKLNNNSNESPIVIYQESYAKIAASIRQANFLRYLIFPRLVQKPFRLAFADASTLQKGYLDILAGKLDYDSLYGLLALQSWKATKKGIRLLGSKFAMNE